MALVRALVDGLTDDDITRRCRGNRSPGYPTDPKRYDYRTCFWVLFNEEWEHHLFAVRDLERLEQDPSAGSPKKPKTTAPKKPVRRSQEAGRKEYGRGVVAPTVPVRIV